MVIEELSYLWCVSLVASKIIDSNYCNSLKTLRKSYSF